MVNGLNPCIPEISSFGLNMLILPSSKCFPDLKMVTSCRFSAKIEPLILMRGCYFSHELFFGNLVTFFFQRNCLPFLLYTKKHHHELLNLKKIAKIYIQFCSVAKILQSSVLFVSMLLMRSSSPKNSDGNWFASLSLLTKAEKEETQFPMKMLALPISTRSN